MTKQENHWLNIYKEHFKTSIDNNSYEDYIIIVDPKHPLFNRKLKLLDVCNKPTIGKCCAVILGNFIKYIPYNSTSLNKTFTPYQTYLCIDSCVGSLAVQRAPRSFLFIIITLLLAIIWI